MAVQLASQFMHERRLKETWPRVYGYFGFRLPREHNQVSCRASGPLDSGYCRDILGRGHQLVFGSAIPAS